MAGLPDKAHMLKANDLIAWSIMNSPVPREADRPRPTPVFDRFSGHMREIAELIVSEHTRPDLPTTVTQWAWDTYNQTFIVHTTTVLMTQFSIGARFELRLDDAGMWLNAFDTFAAELDKFTSRLDKIDTVLAGDRQ